MDSAERDRRPDGSRAVGATGHPPVIYLQRLEGLRGIRHSTWDAEPIDARLVGTPRARRRVDAGTASPERRRSRRPAAAAADARCGAGWRARDALAEMIRAVNASLDPERVADALVAQAPTGCRRRAGSCSPSTTPGGCGRSARRGLTPTLEPPARAVGELGDAARRRCSARADLVDDQRLARSTPRRRRRGASPFRSTAAAGRSARWSALDRGAVDPRADASRRRPLTALLAALEPGAIALDNALRVQRAEALSVTDDLTQLYNSRYLQQVLRRETKRASRSGRPLSLLFIDLDGFKTVNDTHGHLAGSRALVEAAASSAPAPAKPTSSRGSAATSSRSSCPTPAATARWRSASASASGSRRTGSWTATG